LIRISSNHGQNSVQNSPILIVQCHDNQFDNHSVIPKTQYGTMVPYSGGTHSTISVREVSRTTGGNSPEDRGSELSVSYTFTLSSSDGYETQCGLTVSDQRFRMFEGGELFTRWWGSSSSEKLSQWVPHLRRNCVPAARRIRSRGVVSPDISASAVPSRIRSGR
jgi:hypothetical protein